MYGKHFESMYTGSMYGAGLAVFAVWGYIIAHTRPNHLVEVNPHMLAGVLGTNSEVVQDALDFLCSPDDSSRSPEEGGRRLIQEARYMYRVVNHEQYRKIQTDEQRREYNRIKQQECRARKKAQVVTP
jgi:hypothetical protein